MQSGSLGPRRLDRRLDIWARAAVAVLIAGAGACTAKATPPGGDDDPDGSVVRVPADAAPQADASRGGGIDADTTPDAEPPCALPLTIDLDADGYALFDYDHPECSGEPGLGDLESTLVFQDDITDGQGEFSAVHPIEDWQMPEIDYPNLDCAVFPDENTLLCGAEDAGELVPVRLTAGSAQLDVEFRLDHDARTVTVESADYTE